MELKPCPFCGGEAKIARSAPCMNKLSEVVCNICGARTRLFEISTEYASDVEAAKAWNRRANDG